MTDSNFIQEISLQKIKLINLSNLKSYAHQLAAFDEPVLGQNFKYKSKWLSLGQYYVSEHLNQFVSGDFKLKYLNYIDKINSEDSVILTDKQYAVIKDYEKFMNQ